ncbi:MAG: tRNA (guanosine(37)-N1)-methyltransferase TrmD [Candidatus Hydrogenedentes bacterium]|nr:tRNA (guanosine(37)-N1)-methyltransferase TrmD [Candidatus Hydrogenedentota bacterium]
MRIDILTIFPGVFQAPLGAGLLGKAIEAGSLEVVVSDIRDFADDPHRSVDDAPFGGGPGMVMKCGPLFAAVESLEERNSLRRVILLSPKGRRLTQDIVKELAAAPDMVLICGRYEGVDERVGQALCTDELSLGDYVLSGGEFAALVVVDAVGRMLPGVVGDWESVETDSFYHGILGPPQYTRPASFRGIQVPEVLRQGNHEAIRRYRRKEALRATLRQRPELMAKADKSKEDEELLQEIEREEPGPA